ncbi:MAG: nitroreductase [Paenibacillus sp.]|jgi:nitroreductase|nr:nitroreductase [Paenibacillus sp.]
MDVLEAIRSRRSVSVVTNEPVTKEQIETILEAGNWAPSHHMTEPWRFIVMSGEGRRRLAQAYGDVAVEQARAAGGTVDEADVREKQGAKAFRSPVVIAVAATPRNKPNVNRAEEFAAAHCAVQNMLLAAHAIGLGAIWRTGDPTYHPAMQRAFGLNEGEQLVAFVYIGVPQLPLPVRQRAPVAEKTQWIEN